MIVEHYPSKKKKVVAYTNFNHQPTDFETTEAKKKGVTLEEYKRRNDIVRKMWNDCPYRPGAKLWPSNPDKAAIYGEVNVTMICYSYSQMDNDKWPENDNPLIVHATANMNGHKYNFFCTTNFLQEKNPLIKKEESNGSA